MITFIKWLVENEQEVVRSSGSYYYVYTNPTEQELQKLNIFNGIVDPLDNTVYFWDVSARFLLHYIVAKDLGIYDDSNVMNPNNRIYTSFIGKKMGKVFRITPSNPDKINLLKSIPYFVKNTHLFEWQG